MKRSWLIVLLIVTLLTSCGFYGKKRGPTDWYRIPKPSYELPPYAKYLRGMRFCLDPGHGGQAYLPGYKRGPTGVREAEMNLRLAFHLKNFLEQAGAEVILTRDDDYFVSLADRARIANENKVDLFISIHHNASGNPETNYTSVWYHGDADYEPVNLDAARFVCNALIEYLRLPQIVPSPLISDFNMYPSGFGVLRRLRVPGILVEGSFFSNPHEEKLLARDEYNKLFAYAYFIGLAQWAYAGFPKSKLVTPEPDSRITVKTPEIIMEYTDGIHERDAWILERQQVFTESIALFLDGVRVFPVIDRENDRISYTPPQPLSNGRHKLRLNLRNMYGNHNLPENWYFTVAPPAESLYVEPWFTELPPDFKGFVKIRIRAFDGDGEEIADGDTIYITTDYGILERDFYLSRNGGCSAILHADEQPDTAYLKISTGNTMDSLQINFNNPEMVLVEGRIRDRDGNSLDSVRCRVDTLDKMADEDGLYYFDSLVPGEYQFSFYRRGYFSAYTDRNVLKGRVTIINPEMEAILGGVLHGKLVVIDPRWGGSEIGVMINDTLTSAEVNLKIARFLTELFYQAGAIPVLLRKGNVYFLAEERVDSCNALLPEEGTYFRLDVSGWNELKPSVEGMFYPGNRFGEKLSRMIALDLAQLAGDTVIDCHSAYEDLEIRETKYPALAVQANFVNNPVTHSLLTSDEFLWKIAYTIFLNFAEYYLKEGREWRSLKVQLLRETTQEPLSFTPVTISDALTLYTDRRGEVTFPYLQAHEYSIQIALEGGIKKINLLPDKNYVVKVRF